MLHGTFSSARSQSGSLLTAGDPPGKSVSARALRNDQRLQQLAGRLSHSVPQIRHRVTTGTEDDMTKNQPQIVDLATLHLRQALRTVCALASLIAKVDPVNEPVRSMKERYAHAHGAMQSTDLTVSVSSSQKLNPSSFTWTIC